MLVSPCMALDHRMVEGLKAGSRLEAVSWESIALGSNIERGHVPCSNQSSSTGPIGDEASE